MALNYAKTNTFSTGTTISSSAVNANFDDVVNVFAGLENLSKSFTSLLIDTTLRSAGTIQSAIGAVTNPGITFTVETDSGFYRIGSKNIGLAINAVKRLDVSDTAMTMAVPIAMGTSKITGLGNGTAATDAAAYGQLHLLQAPVNTLLTSEFSTTSSTLQSTGLAATITPTSTSSKILIFVSGSAGSNNAAGTAFIMTIKRGSTDLAGGATNGLYQCLGTGATGWRFALPLAFLDSPASVAALTYTLFIRSSDNATACLVAVGSNESISMTLLEVA